MTFTVRYHIGAYSGTETVEAATERQAIRDVREAYHSLRRPGQIDTYEVIEREEVPWSDQLDADSGRRAM